jgi:hypothetical protein
MISVNEKWAKSVSFAVFCKAGAIAKLSPVKQKELYESTTGKKLKTKKGAK